MFGKNNIQNLLITSILLQFLIYGNSLSKESIVVMPFEDKSGNVKMYGEKLNAVIEEQLIKTKDFEVINRTELNKIFDEQKLGLAGIIDEKEAAGLGKIAGAKKAVVGKIYSLINGFGICEINAEIKFIDTETAVLYKEINVRERARDFNPEKAALKALEKVGERFYAEYKGGEDKLNLDKRNKKEDLDNAMFVNINIGYSTLVIKDFTTIDSNFYLERKNISGVLNLGGEIGKKYENFSLEINGRIASAAPFSIYKLGLSVGYRVLEKDRLSVKLGTGLELTNVSGKVGKVFTSDMNIGGTKYADESEVILNNFFFGIEPFAKASYDVTESVSLFVNARYNLYMDTKAKLQVKDKYNGNVGNIDLEGFKGIVDLNGIEASAGIEFVW